MSAPSVRNTMAEMLAWPLGKLRPVATSSGWAAQPNSKQALRRLRFAGVGLSAPETQSPSMPPSHRDAVTPSRQRLLERYRSVLKPLLIGLAAVLLTLAFVKLAGEVVRAARPRGCAAACAQRRLVVDCRQPVAVRLSEPPIWQASE